MFCQRLIKASVSPFIRNRIQTQFNRQRFYSVYEPDYLEAMKPSIPLYDTIDVLITGYNYQVLESYQKYLHKLATNMDIDVEDCWAIPPQSFEIKRFKHRSSIVDSEYKLKTYERHIQITDLPSTMYPIFLRVVQASVPEGVTVTVREHDPAYEEVRYVPDSELRELKKTLDDLGGPRKIKS